MILRSAASGDCRRVRRTPSAFWGRSHSRACDSFEAARVGQGLEASLHELHLFTANVGMESALQTLPHEHWRCGVSADGDNSRQRVQ